MTGDALDGWMAVIAAEGWAGATLARVASEAGLAPGEVAAAAPDPWRALEQVADRADRAAIAAAGDGAGLPVRDRLFDLIMARFDALSAARDGHRRILADARFHPALAAACAALLGRTAARLLGAAGLSATRLLGIARVHALAAIIADCGRVWLGDTDADLGSTMQRLDARLGLAERWALRLGGTRRENAAEMETTAAPV